MFDSVTGRLYNPGDLPAAVAAIRRLDAARAAAEHRRTRFGIREAGAFVQSNCGALRGHHQETEVEQQDVSSGNAAQRHRPLALRRNARPDRERLAARLDALVGQFVSLHMDTLRKRIGTAEKAITALFSQPLLGAVDAPLKAYVDLVPGVQIGFEPGASAQLSVRPKQDFSRSPDYCLNTVTLRFSGTSRWFTVEVQADWAEFQNCSRFQIGLYCSTDRVAAGHIVLRLPRKGGAIDHRLADFRLTPDGRCCHRSGALNIPSLADADLQRRPKLIFFFDSASDLTLESRLPDGVLRLANMSVALAVVTIERPHAVARLVRSARRFLPNVPIYVADQSANIGLVDELYAAHNVNVVRMPFDAGLAASRNALVGAISEDYFLLCDDDFVLCEASRLDDAVAVLDGAPDIAVVGGVCTTSTNTVSACATGRCTSNTIGTTAPSLRYRYTTMRRTRAQSLESRYSSVMLS